jgi:hypothetical protein
MLVLIEKYLFVSDATEQGGKARDPDHIWLEQIDHLRPALSACF